MRIIIGEVEEYFEFPKQNVSLKQVVAEVAAVPAEDFSRGEKFTPFAKFESNSDGLRVPDTSGKGNFTEALEKVLSGEPSAGTAAKKSKRLPIKSIQLQGQ